MGPPALPQRDFDKKQVAWKRAFQAAGQHRLVLEGQGTHQNET